MSLFSTLYTSAGGMEAQQRATANISTNIANISTSGYKRSDMSFKELVADTGRVTERTTVGAPNSVYADRILRATSAGTVRQTASSTDAAVVGNGFFVVKAGVDPAQEFLYTRAGDFSEDASGILRNTAGFVLHGWRLDQNGVPNTGSLVPVNVALLQTQIQSTTAASLAVNLDASEDDYNPTLFATPSTLPVTSQDPHFTRSLKVYDAQGTAREVSLEFRKITGPMAQFTSRTDALDPNDVLVDNASGPTPFITNGDIMEITDGTETLTINFVNAPADLTLNEANTMKDVLDVINRFTDTDGNLMFEARLNAQGRLLVQSINPSAPLDISTSSTNVLGANGFEFIPDPVDLDYVYEPAFDINADVASSIYPTQGSLPPIANTTNPNTQNWWELTITIPDPANPTGTAKSVLRQGVLNFNSLGALNATANADGEMLIDLASSPINYDSSTTAEDAGFTIDIRRFTQFSGNFDVIESAQNGAGLGNYVGASIDRNGIVTAKYSNGQQVNFYQLPLANFTNANGLQEMSGTTFRQTEAAGELSINAPGTGGTGYMLTSSIEGSNVDLSNEFGNLITTQRAFSLNGQVLNAVDEMTRNLSQLA